MKFGFGILILALNLLAAALALPVPIYTYSDPKHSTPLNVIAKNASTGPVFAVAGTILAAPCAYYLAHHACAAYPTFKRWGKGKIDATVTKAGQIKDTATQTATSAAGKVHGFVTGTGSSMVAAAKGMSNNIAGMVKGRPVGNVDYQYHELEEGPAAHHDEPERRTYDEELQGRQNSPSSS